MNLREIHYAIEDLTSRQGHLAPRSNEASRLKDDIHSLRRLGRELHLIDSLRKMSWAEILALNGCLHGVRSEIRVHGTEDKRGIQLRRSDETVIDTYRQSRQGLARLIKDARTELNARVSKVTNSWEIAAVPLHKGKNSRDERSHQALRLGRAITLGRKARSTSQARLAGAIRVSVDTIAQIEAGTASVGIVRLARIAKALSIRPRSLLSKCRSMC